MTSRRVVGLVLAAGEGRRLGQPKALVESDGQTWLARAVAALHGGGVSDVCVVVGAAATSVSAAVPEGCRIVEALNWREGMGASLRAGLAEVAVAESSADAVMVMLVDTPGVSAEVVRRLSASATPGVLARAAYAGQSGHPVLLGRHHWHGIAGDARADEGARGYLRSHLTTLVECSDIGAGEDIDTADQLADWRHHRTVPELPTGTLTMLFSDIEGSTQLLSRLGPEYTQALTGQREILRSAWSTHGGTEMGTEGDSFFVVFPTASDAVGAAIEGQRELAAYSWPRGERVRVRMGLHTGSPRVHDGGYVGMDVHRAARVASAAHGGQVVLSEATALLAGAGLPVGVALQSLGSHRLKDLPAPEKLFQLTVAGLPSEFPPVKTLGESSSLPTQGAALVGRQATLASLENLVTGQGARLVTLTGPGGSGKTRLAIALAYQLAAAYPDGVYFVPLAPVSSAEAMWTTIAEALDAPPEGRIPPGFFTHVAHRSALLVLDNLEQLSAAEAVVAELLRQAPQVDVLATSRRPLHLQDEYEYPVPPLELPAGHSLAAAESSGSVQLFVQQARRVRPDFRLTVDNVADVIAICRRLDGLPLAIELTAARSKLLSPRALVARQNAALDIAAAGSQVPVRQKTLRDTISWSYELLTSSQQRLFRRLGVFAGGADLDAVSVVAVDALDGADPLDHVMDLVDASLLTVTEAADGEPRVAMLNTIGDFAVDALHAAQEQDRIQERHARHYLALAQELDPMLRGEHHPTARARFETEHDNLREALRWMHRTTSTETGVPDRANLRLQLCHALGYFWQTNGYLAEGRSWFEDAIATAGDGDRPELADCLRRLANISRFLGYHDRARQCATASVDMSRRLQDNSRLALSLIFLAAVEGESGDLAAARACHVEALGLARSCDDPWLLAFSLRDFGAFLSMERNDSASLELVTEALAVSREVGDPHLVNTCEHLVARAMHMSGYLVESYEQQVALIPRTLEINNSGVVMELAEDLAAILAELGHGPESVRLLGAAEAMRERHGMSRDFLQRDELEGPMAKIRATLSSQEWDEAYRAGQSTTVEDELRRLRASPGPGPG